MLARRMLEVYEPSRAKRNELYRQKVPGIMARLQAAELIARRIGLINRDVFSFSSGIFIREYRRNLAVMKLISHALYELEMDGWIKVTPTKIYYLDNKLVETVRGVEKQKIFHVIAETVKEIETIFNEGEFSNKSASSIEHDCGSLFVRTNDLGRAERFEEKRRKDFWERHDYSPLTKRAAMDIAASGYFYTENKKVFERPAVSFAPVSGDTTTDFLRSVEALQFDQYISTEVARAKEISGRELREEFSLGVADRSTLFPGTEEYDFLREVGRAFKLTPEEERDYIEQMSKFSPGEVGKAESMFLHKFLSAVKLEFMTALSSLHIETLPEVAQREFLSQVKEAFPEILDEFVGTLGAHDFLLFLKQKHQDLVKDYEGSFRAGVTRTAGRFFERIVLDIIKKLEASQPYDVTYVISDLHLQDYVHRDVYELLRLIHVVVSTGGTLVINGDFLDTWRASNLALIIKNNKLLIDALRKVKRVVIIKGNHDGWLELFKGQKLFGDNISVVDRLWMRNLHIEHGNDFDKFNSEVSWIGRLATRVVDKLQKNEFVGPQFLTWIEYVGKRLLPDSKWTQQKVDRVLKGIQEVHSKRDPDGEIYSKDDPLNIVFGHYHFPGLFHAYDKINERIDSDERLKGKVRFFLTDSWYESEGYAGQVTVFAKSRRSPAGQMLTKTFIWDYIDAKKILTLYGAWKF
jgi:UDP-2,3-diacylglucosamine pyrophosphatase LpxH